MIVSQSAHSVLFLYIYQDSPEIANETLIERRPRYSPAKNASPLFHLFDYSAENATFDRLGAYQRTARLIVQTGYASILPELSKTKVTIP